MTCDKGAFAHHAGSFVNQRSTQRTMARISNHNSGAIAATIA
jgi:hypothetical protein